MNKRLLIRLAVIAIVAVLGYFKTEHGPKGDASSPPTSIAQTAPAKTTPKLKENLNFNSSKTVMKNMQIRDVDGSIAYRGDVDLGPTIKRIKSGKRDSHANDGSVFGNRERRLPQKERGYYREYVVRTKGIRHAGPQRLIVGKKGEIYYTHDHYKSFQKIQQ